MTTQRFVARLPLPVDATTAYEWHARPGALQRLLPPWQAVNIVHSASSLEVGSTVELKMAVGPFWTHWLAEHTRHEAPHLFQDVQRRGPFQKFEHTHRFLAESASSSILEDEICYQLPFGALGQLIADSYVRHELARMFHYRHLTTLADLQSHQRFSHLPRKTIAVSGSTGLIGSTLVPFLTTGGHTVRRIIRDRQTTRPDIAWNSKEGTFDATALEGVDAVVHLAGESIGDRWWTPAVKQSILESRVQGTEALCRTLASLQQPPRVLVCTSAIGYYGDRQDMPLTEVEPSGAGFLAEVCQKWEAATEVARQAGIRVVHARLGIVLSARGGALRQLVTPTKWGVGGPMGAGNQYWSWVALDDVIAALYETLMNDSLQGPVNITAPEPVRQRDLIKTLGRLLHRPTFIRLPRPLAKLMLGERAEELLFTSARVLPQKLETADYPFRFRTLSQALIHELGLKAEK